MPVLPCPSAQTVTLADKMGVAPTNDSPKFDWDSAAGTGAAFPAKLMGAIDPGKVFLDKVRPDARG
jgi:alanyl-tRNA synthetase